jgi:hypothetical protein
LQPRTALYEHCLAGLHHLLVQVGDERWAQWVEQDLAEWRERRDPSHHLRAYGGMDSIDSVAFGPEHPHLSREQTPWVAVLHASLTSMCHHLAEYAERDLGPGELREELFIDGQPVAELTAPDEPPQSLAGLFSGANPLPGDRCGECGHAWVRRGDIDAMIARKLVPRGLLDACEHRRVPDFVDRVLALDIPAADDLRARVRAVMQQNDMPPGETTGAEPCPECGSDEVTFCEWVLADEETGKLVPALHGPHEWPYKSLLSVWLLSFLIAGVALPALDGTGPNLFRFGMFLGVSALYWERIALARWNHETGPGYAFYALLMLATPFLIWPLQNLLEDLSASGAFPV